MTGEAFPEDMSAPDTTSPEEEVRAIGYLKQDGLVYILKEEENGWLYVESGTVRGFIRKDEVRTGEEAQNLLETYQQEAKQKAEEMGQEYSGIEIAAPIAEVLVSPADNEAYTWIRATVDQTVMQKTIAEQKQKIESLERENARLKRAIDQRSVNFLKNL